MKLKVPPGTVKKVLKYSLLPDVIRRVRGLGLGFPFLAYQMAIIFSQFGLLPRFHAYLNPANVGLYSIRQVMVEGARSLRPGFSHIDQKVIFFLFLTIFVILTIQFLVVFGMLGISAANAAGFDSLFISPTPDFDLALVTLDRVFGVPNVFGSCVSTGVDCTTMWPKGTPDPPAFPSSFHVAFHKLLSFYSEAMLLVGVVILFYYFFVMMGESAQTGSPFGRRFDSIYAPLRLIICVALLLPISYGLNFGQHITLHIANWGSGLASNGWKVFNTGLANALDLDSKQMVARPQLKDVSGIVRFMVIAQTCRAGYEEESQKDVQPYLVKDVRNLPAASTSYDNARKFYEDSDILIRFGWYDSSKPGNLALFKGGIPPACGELVIRANDVNQIGSAIVYEYFYKTILQMWNDASLRNTGKAIYYANDFSDQTKADTVTGGITGWGSNPLSPAVSLFIGITNNWQATFEGVVDAARAALIGSNAFVVDPKIGQLGWAGAGIWFNKIAEKNGAFLSAAANIPEVVSYPRVMEDVRAVHMANDGVDVDTSNPYTLRLKSGNNITIQSSVEAPIANALGESWNLVVVKKPLEPEGGNMIVQAITQLFGISGLFNMRNNPDIHPFAQIVALGRGLIDHTILFLMTGTLTSFAEGVAKQSAFGSGIISGFLFTFAAIGLSAGFFMYYVIPFLPFMYFFFGLMKWVIIVFEAIVCVPVWALAHLRIDGEGLMGDQAMTGYGQLLEILLRPIMTVFGLLAAITIFSALVAVLNSIFDLVVSNLTGFSPKDPNGQFNAASVDSYRGVIDQFAFTVIYAILVYMIGISSFKLIDTIPQAIFRWMDMDVKNIADNLGSGEMLIGDKGVAAVYTTSSRLITGKAGFNVPGISGESAGLDDVVRGFGGIFSGGRGR